MVKLWILLSKFENGGLERVQLNLATELVASGIDVCLVAGTISNHFIDELEKLSTKELCKNRSRLVFPFSLFREMRKGPPSHIMTTANDIAIIALLLKTIFFPKIKIIVSQHSAISESVKKANRFQRLKSCIMIFLLRKLLPNADAIVAVSQGVSHDIAKELRVRVNTISVIYNPIVTPDYLQYHPPLTASQALPPNIVFVGRLTESKRLDLLFTAFKNITLSPPPTLTIVGDGPLYDWAVQYIKDSGLESRCQTTGFLLDPRHVIAMSNLLVLPSDYEGFGNVIVEALAMGTQVVSTNCKHGPEEILSGGKFGQLVPPGDAEELTKAITKSLNGEFYIAPARLKQRARLFTAERAVKKYLRILH